MTQKSVNATFNNGFRTQSYHLGQEEMKGILAWIKKWLSVYALVNFNVCITDNLHSTSNLSIVFHLNNG